MTKENTLYIGIDPSMTATGMCGGLENPHILVFPATHFYRELRDFDCEYAITDDDITVCIEVPTKTDGNPNTGKGNTRIVRACAAQMVKDLKKIFPTRGTCKVASLTIYELTPGQWREYAYGLGGRFLSTADAKAAAVALTGIKNHNAAEAVILRYVGEWLDIAGAGNYTHDGVVSWDWIAEKIGGENG